MAILRAMVAVLGVVAWAGCSFSPSAEGSGLGSLPSLAPDAGDPGPGSAPDSAPTDPKPTSGPGHLIAHKVSIPPSVQDSAYVESEWHDADDIWFDMNDSVIDMNDGDYTASATARIAAVHTETDIYLLVAVDDTDVRDGDAIELFIDSAGDALGPYGVDDHDLVIGPYRDGVMQYNDRASDLDIGGMLIPTKGRYVMELRIAKNSMGADPLPQTLGFNFAIIDQDADGLGYGLWYAAAGPHCENCCEDVETGPWCDTTTNGMLTLLEDNL